MAKKYKVLKVMKVGSIMVGPGAATWENEEFTKVNAELVEIYDTNKEDVLKAAKEADVILLGTVPVSRWIIEAAPKCIAVMCQSVGYDMIDVKACNENNILVVNNPSFEWCIEEVSNHAITLLLDCAKKVMKLDGMVREGRWAEAKKAQPWMGSIFGQTLGIVGCGAIGRMVARKAQCFGLKVSGYDPYIMHPYLAKESGIRLTTLEETLGADYVSLHPDLNDTSLHMINDKAFTHMKPHAYLINTSRGKVVDEVALVKALQEKKIAGAGLDVFETEPLPKDSPLMKMDNVVLLPHSASYSTPAFDLAPINIAYEVARVLTGKMPKNVVNKSITLRVKLV
jgi:D-3-phosphoglycerate dehydrogenase / 2-oxoglutarate reductase